MNVPLQNARKTGRRTLPSLTMAPPIQASPALSARPCPRPAAQRGVALIITLVVLFLIVVIAVILATAVRSERSSAGAITTTSGLKPLASMAVDDVAATLRNNIPLNSQWGVGGGSLYRPWPRRLFAFAAGAPLFRQRRSVDQFHSPADQRQRRLEQAESRGPDPVSDHALRFALCGDGGRVGHHAQLHASRLAIHVTQDGTRLPTRYAENPSKNYDPVNNPI